MLRARGRFFIMTKYFQVKRYGHTFHEAEIGPHDTYDFGARVRVLTKGLVLYSRFIARCIL